MICPVDQTQLVITERQGIEIDYCPTCRGVWLDRGELDKLIDRQSSFATPRYDDRRGYSDEPRERRSDDYDRRHHDDDHHGHHKKHKKEGFLGELFDFG